MKRLMEKIVFSGFVTCWRFAGTPTSRSPPWVKATTDGVVRPPSRFGMTVGSPPSSTAMHELVVPRSIPIVLAMFQIPPREEQKDQLKAERRGRRPGVARNLSVVIAGLRPGAGV